MHSFQKNKGVPFFLLAGTILLLVFLFLSFSPNSPSFDSTPDCLSPFRENYSISPAVFSLLPDLPPCISSLSSAVETGSFTQLENLSPAFYLQPEFFPSFEKEGLSLWKNPSTTHYGAVGYGAFPFEKNISLERGTTIRTRFFLHTGYGIRAFQEGYLSLQTDYPDIITASLDENSSRSFVLEPSFPQFYSGWVHPVDVTISVSPVAPSANYTLYVYSNATPADEQLFFPEAGEYYYSLTQFVGSRTVAVIRINVIEKG